MSDGIRFEVTELGRPRLAASVEASGNSDHRRFDF
jgi:hypothetical protein